MRAAFPAPRAAAVAAVLILTAGSCGGGEGSGTTVAATTPVPTTTAVRPAPDSCGEATSLFPVAAVVGEAGHPCEDWVDVSMGRAVLGSTGSASLWSRRTGHGTALVVGAIHTLGEGWFGPSGTEIEARMWDPADQIGVLRLHLMLPDGSGPDPLASPLFNLYSPGVAAERNGNRMQDVLPAEDFYVGVADSQKFDVSGPVPGAEPIVFGPVPVHDPQAATLGDPTFDVAAGGDLVLLLGFPNQTRRLSAAVGRVLGDAEASEAVAALAGLGDPEGDVPYDPAVEMIIEGAALAGMSGGPVVDRDGRLVGILVRASEEHDGVQYVRAVRMTYVAGRLSAAFDSLPAATREALRGYLED